MLWFMPFSFWWCSVCLLPMVELIHIYLKNQKAASLQNTWRGPSLTIWGVRLKIYKSIRAFNPVSPFKLVLLNAKTLLHKVDILCWNASSQDQLLSSIFSSMLEGTLSSYTQTYIFELSPHKKHLYTLTHCPTALKAHL